MTDVVQGAGGVLSRVRADGAVEVLVVHRPKYDDWTFPKGKLDPGETHEAGAVREVEEETGFRCTLGPALTEVSYIDHRGRPKTVRYWLMTIVDGAFVPTDEVDELRWLTADEARPLLSYDRERHVLDAFLATR